MLAEASTLTFWQVISVLLGLSGSLGGTYLFRRWIQGDPPW
jgi:hypothetical protein